MDYRAELDKLNQKKLLRNRVVRTSKVNRYVSVNGKQCLNFSCNDYLGLSSHPEILSSAMAAAQKFGYGSTGSALISGYTSVHQELEYAIAAHTGFERALVFSSGFLANLGIAQSVLKRGDLLLQDKLNHASLIDAATLANAQLKRFKHLNLNDADRLLGKYSDQPQWICSDGIFSMDGDAADLLNLSVLALKHDAKLWIDDAHGIGVYGEHGRGLIEAQNLQAQSIDVLTGTFGKAFASSGAFVLADSNCIEWILQNARTYKYNTSMSIADAAAALKAIELVQSETWRREKLWELIDYYKQQLQHYDLAESDSDSAIQPFHVGSVEKTIRLAEELNEKGIFVMPIRPPTVAKGTSRIRVTLHSMLEKEDIDILIQCFLGNY